MQKAKKIAVYALVFLFGVILAPKTTTKTETVIKEVPVETQNISEWKALKQVDDEAFSYCSDFAGYATNAFDAASRFDANGITLASQQMSTLTPKIQDVASRRYDILTKLGY